MTSFSWDHFAGSGWLGMQVFIPAICWILLFWTSSSTPAVSRVLTFYTNPDVKLWLDLG
jgi:F0F1-type ATP synthase assembly protein I